MLLSFSLLLLPPGTTPFLFLFRKGTAIEKNNNKIKYKYKTNKSERDKTTSPERRTKKKHKKFIIHIDAETQIFEHTKYHKIPNWKS